MSSEEDGICHWDLGRSDSDAPFFLAEASQVPSFASLQRCNRGPLLEDRMADPARPRVALHTNQHNQQSQHVQ